VEDIEGARRAMQDNGRNDAQDIRVKRTTGGKPRMLVVLPSTVIGGAETQTRQVVAGLQALEPTLLLQAPNREYFRSLDVPIHLFEDHGCTGAENRSPARILRYTRAVRRVARAEKVEVCLGIMEMASLFGALARDVFRLGAVPVATIRGNLTGFYEHLGRKETLRERLMFRYIFRRSAAVLVPSRGVRLDLVRNHCAPAHRVTTILNGFDVERILAAAKRPPGRPKTCPWLVTASRLSPEKDFSTLLEAFARIRRERRVKLLILGEGEMRRAIVSDIRRLGLAEEVVLAGYQDNPFPVMAAADVFLVSSRFEGFCNAIVEAMALGRPVVATDAPSGPGEILQGGKSGFLVPVGDPDAMARACLRLLGDTDLRDRMGAAARERARAFSLEKTVAEYERKILSLIR